jgi:hypothetical protein
MSCRVIRPLHVRQITPRGFHKYYSKVPIEIYFHLCCDNNNIKVPILDIVVHAENICTPGRNGF